MKEGHSEKQKKNKTSKKSTSK